MLRTFVIFMRTVLIGMACLSLLVADGRRWKLHPTLDAAVERIKIGELTSVRGPDPVIGAADEQARLDYLKTVRANDKEGIKELADAGQIATLSEGTEVRVLERNEADLDKLMDTVHRLMDIDHQMYKDCMESNMRRASAGLRLIQCGNLSFENNYETRTAQILATSPPEAFVDAHVLVRVRVLTGKESGKKLWVPYGLLAAPSHPDPPSK